MITLPEVSKGFYVHYKGGIYFVTAVLRDGDDHGSDKQLVCYETVQGCEPGPDHGPRYRTVKDFIEPVDPSNGHLAGVYYDADKHVPRFQRVVDFQGGHPVVMRGKISEVFVTPFSPVNKKDLKQPDKLKAEEYVIAYNGTPKSYFKSMVGGMVGGRGKPRYGSIPAFGAKLDETPRYLSLASANSAINSFPMMAGVLCEAVPLSKAIVDEAMKAKKKGKRS